MATDPNPFEHCVWPACQKRGLPALCKRHHDDVPEPVRRRLADAVIRNDQAAWRVAVDEVRIVAIPR